MERNEFEQRLEQSGLGSTARFLKEPQFQSLDLSAVELANELVRECQLTDYQANVLLNPSSDPLRFGKYLILDKIGQGGMGVVFKAKEFDGNGDYSYDQLIALKLLPTRMSNNETAIRRFTREAELAIRLVHPNIVRAIEYGEHDGRHYFAMEYVDGYNVKDYLERRGSGLAMLTAFEFLRDATKSLASAHANSVIHRDIKPSNMLVHRNGTLKVLDMGLARLMIDDDSHGDELTDMNLTMTGTVLGTTGYMAPEQAMNSKNADHRSDIYSLGCTFYYFLFGEDIYGGETMVEKIVSHRESPIPDLCELRNDVPRPVQKMFEKMVAKQVDERYQTVGELLSDIELSLKEFGHMWMIQRYLHEKKGRTTKSSDDSSFEI